MSSYISYSDQIHYRMQFSIFSTLEEYTEKMNNLCMPSLLACNLSHLESLIWLIATISEKTIHGVGLLIAIPFVDDRDYTIRKGYTLLKKIPSECLGLFIGLPLSCIISPFFAIGNPKDFMLTSVGHAKIDYIHAEAGTFDSKEHNWDLSDAAGRANEERIKHAKYLMMQRKLNLQ